MKTGLFLLSITLLFVITLFGWYVWYNEQDKQELRVTQEAVEETLFPMASPTPTSQPDNTQETGTITGSLSFPSETIPPMIICAEQSTAIDDVSVSQFCTEENIENEAFQYGVGYNLEVPAGEYFVYASLANDPYRAYYNQFVVCGLSVECDSHEPVPVTVMPGATVSEIDPQDWYNRDEEELSL